MNDNPQYTLSEHLCAIQNQSTITCMKHWRALLEKRIEPADLEEVRAFLVTLEQRIQYAKNCVYWINDQQSVKPGPNGSTNKAP